MSLVLGTMNIDYPYTSNNDKTIDSYTEIIKKYVELSPNPVIDTAYYYGNTNTEKILGKIISELLVKPKIATKANPWFNNDFTNGKFGQLSKLNLQHQICTSLQNLNIDKVDIFYLHCWDYETPLIETLDICDELWRKDKFDYLGVSNFSKNQLEQVLELADKYQYESPKYYQGMYNIISRKVEEIFPILEDWNIEFWAYNPLAGGILTGKYKNRILDENSRFKSNSIYQNIFWKDEIFDNFEDFFNLPNPIDYSYHWLKSYSKLRNTDKIILGVSTLEQLETNLNIINNNVFLDKNILENLDKSYSKIKDISPNYYY